MAAEDMPGSGGGLGVNRREFLASCVGGVAGAYVSGVKTLLAADQPAATAAATGPAGDGKCRIRLVFTHLGPKTPTWPNIGYDYEGRKKELTEKLRQACPDVDFIPVTVNSAAEAKKIVEADGPVTTQPATQAATKSATQATQPGAQIDAYLVYIVGIWTGAPGVLVASGRPTILANDLYAGCGEFLVAYAGAKRKGLRVAGVSSSRFEDVVDAVRCVECVKKLRSSAILVVGANPGKRGKDVEEVFGTKVIPITFEQLDEAYTKADRAEAAKWAERWTKEAEKVVEPSKEDVENGGAMYLAMSDLLRQHKAQGITINCLGGFYGGKMKAYPCMGFFQFNNDGGVGACEADVRCTISMLVMTYLTHRPGYISDPVIDTSKNQIIYAHCVASNKVFGPKGASNPYHIRSHSEDRKGAVVRSLMPLGEMTTTVLFDPGKKQTILHQAKTVANIDEDKACRTKLAAEVVGDIDKLLGEWDQWGWHRVTVYGDLRRQVEHFSALAGFSVLKEA